MEQTRQKRTAKILLATVLTFVVTLAMVFAILPGMSLTALADGTPAYSGGTGTEADPYLISTADDWKALATAVNGGTNYSGNYFKQTANLDMSGAGDLVPVGTLTASFAGNYDGCGFAISGAEIEGVSSTVNGQKYMVAGAFGVLEGGGSVTNLRVKNSNITANTTEYSQAYAGGIAAIVENYSVTDCCVMDSKIKAYATGRAAFCGGIVGFAQSGTGETTTIKRCASENNTITTDATNNQVGYGGGFVGAIINQSGLTFTDCYSAKNTISSSNRTMNGAFCGGYQIFGKATLTNGFVYGCTVTTGENGIASLFGYESDSTKYSVSATNTYYYDTQSLPVNASATSATADEMKSLKSSLGDAFFQGNDYPVLQHPIRIGVTAEDRVYGEDAEEPSVTGNSSDGTVTFQYKTKDAEDSTYSETVPTDVGEYTVKVTVKETDHFKGGEATANFTIRPNDKTKLIKGIDSASEYYDSIKTKYPEIASALKAAIDAANEIKDDDNKTVDEISGALSALENQVEVSKVEVLIESIDGIAYTADSKNRIDKAKAAYNNLTDKQKQAVQNYDALLDAQETYETAKADYEVAFKATAYIDFIGEVEYSVACRNAIANARKIYNSLTVSQKAYVGNYETLTAAEKAYAALAAEYRSAEVVKERIAFIGEVTINSKTVIDEAREAYDGLNDKQKAIVDNYDVLVEAEKTYAALVADKAAADEVAALIANIGTVTVDSKAAIEGARKAYDGLTAEQKALVGNYEVLTAAETAYETAKADKEAADKVAALIANIGTVTVDSKAAIEDARKAYDGLTAEQKALVGNYGTLTAAEKAYETAKADKAAADEVAALIANIGTVTKDSKAAIDAAKAAYEGLTAEQKALVGNYGTLTAAETAYAALTDDKEEESVSTGESANEESASEEEKKGCGSSVGIGSVLGIMLIVCALFLFRKKGFIR